MVRLCCLREGKTGAFGQRAGRGLYLYRQIHRSARRAAAPRFPHAGDAFLTVNCFPILPQLVIARMKRATTKGERSAQIIASRSACGFAGSGAIGDERGNTPLPRAYSLPVAANPSAAERSVENQARRTARAAHWPAEKLPSIRLRGARQGQRPLLG